MEENQLHLHIACEAYKGNFVFLTGYVLYEVSLSQDSGCFYDDQRLTHLLLGVLHQMTVYHSE